MAEEPLFGVCHLRACQSSGRNGWAGGERDETWEPRHSENSRMELLILDVELHATTLVVVELLRLAIYHYLYSKIRRRPEVTRCKECRNNKRIDAGSDYRQRDS